MNKPKHTTIGDPRPNKPMSGIAEPPRLTEEDEQILDRVSAKLAAERKAGTLKPIPPKPATPFLPPSKREKVAA